MRKGVRVLDVAEAHAPPSPRRSARRAQRSPAPPPSVLPSPCGVAARGRQYASMEFLNFLIILVAAWLVWRRPERERLAFGLLVASCLLMALLFSIGARGSLVPGVNL
jgi:hypothetical protein